jgi:hypothetical protein
MNDSIKGLTIYRNRIYSIHVLLIENYTRSRQIIFYEYYGIIHIIIYSF